MNDLLNIKGLFNGDIQIKVSVNNPEDWQKLYNYFMENETKFVSDFHNSILAPSLLKVKKDKERREALKKEMDEARGNVTDMDAVIRFKEEHGAEMKEKIKKFIEKL